MARVYVLGAGTPTPTPQRFGSSFVAECGDYQVMIDCGPAATHKLVKAGLWPTNIDHLFFTDKFFSFAIYFSNSSGLFKSNSFFPSLNLLKAENSHSELVLNHNPGFLTFNILFMI